MTVVLTNAEKIRRLPWNIGLNALNNVFAILIYFGPAWVLFLNELGFTNTEIGFLLSLIPFSGLVALAIAPAVARFGYKRTFVTFYGLRTIITLGLLLVPWLLAQYGTQTVIIYVTVITAGFAVSRSIAETGLFPWTQEFIPNSMRGRFAALNDMSARVTGIISVGVASYILSLPHGLDRYMLLFAIGLIFAAAAWWCSTHMPGGAPRRDADASKMSHRHLVGVLKDKNFLLYIAGIGILTIGTTPMSSFLPLYVEQQVGLSESLTVLLQIGGLVGGLVSTYLLGWASDRYGSKPVMLSGLYIKILIPLAWLLIPRGSGASLPIALVISMVGGAADIAWALGSARLLFVKVVPTEKSSEYMAVYYALVGLIGGLGSVLGGRLLDFTQGLSGQFLIFTVDPFFPLFVLALVLTSVSIYLFNRVQADSPVSVSEFAGLFIHGNPVLALESMFRYYRAKDERQTIAMTERMGQTKSPLTVDELLEALKDPRFNVRFEAIISIARTEADPRLVEALSKIVIGTEVSLSVIAAWALGRLGDTDAIPALRHGLDSHYRSIQAHCARALGTLNDQETAPVLLERLKMETDKGLVMAYSSALGNLHYGEAITTLLDVLYHTENEGARLELALALARIIGQEHHFIYLLRQMRQDRGTAASHAVTVFKRRAHLNEGELADLAAETADTLAREDFDKGIEQFVQLVQALPPDMGTHNCRTVLAACAARLPEVKLTRGEYLLLGLYSLEIVATSLPE
jgi:Na+/melibiose symporter-like transporter